MSWDFAKNFEPLSVPVFTGGAYERGRKLVEHFTAARERLLKQLAKGVRLREQNGEGDWLKENWLRLQAIFPEGALYMRGQADGLGVPVEDLLASSHADLLNDREKARRAREEGDGIWDEECSTFAFPVSEGGALVAKNRDNPPGASDRHTLALHRDPSWEVGWVLAISSVGSAMVASSGINGHGLVMVCNAVRPRAVGNGFHKAAVADAFLSRCRTVDEALALIRSIRHVGEGHLLLADRTGRVAAVAMVGEAPDIEVPQGPGWVAKTNHFVGEAFAHLNQRQADDPKIHRNSRGRLRYLREALSTLEMPWCRGWDEAARWSMEKLAHHDETGATTLSFDNDRAYTACGTVFRTDPPALLISDGPPTRGRWRYWQPEAV
ncbi:MAG TPA: C45 family peptidase [Chthoniobacteraceae bacterium]|nr:C45 family peptidase [Chthoniobacteraceae bacterium]